MCDYEAVLGLLKTHGGVIHEDPWRNATVAVAVARLVQRWLNGEMAGSPRNEKTPGAPMGDRYLGYQSIDAFYVMAPKYRWVYHKESGMLAYRFEIPRLADAAVGPKDTMWFAIEDAVANIPVVRTPVRKDAAGNRSYLELGLDTSMQWLVSGWTHENHTVLHLVHYPAFMKLYARPEFQEKWANEWGAFVEDWAQPGQPMPTMTQSPNQTAARFAREKPNKAALVRDGQEWQDDLVANCDSETCKTTIAKLFKTIEERTKQNVQLETRLKKQLFSEKLELRQITRQDWISNGVGWVANLLAGTIPYLYNLDRFHRAPVLVQAAFAPQPPRPAENTSPLTTDQVVLEMEEI